MLISSSASDPRGGVLRDKLCLLAISGVLGGTELSWTIIDGSVGCAGTSGAEAGGVATNFSDTAGAKVESLE